MSSLQIDFIGTFSIHCANTTTGSCTCTCHILLLLSPLSLAPPSVLSPLLIYRSCFHFSLLFFFLSRPFLPLRFLNYTSQLSDLQVCPIHTQTSPPSLSSQPPGEPSYVWHGGSHCKQARGPRNTAADGIPISSLVFRRLQL